MHETRLTTKGHIISLRQSSKLVILLKILSRLDFRLELHPPFSLFKTLNIWWHCSGCAPLWNFNQAKSKMWNLAHTFQIECKIQPKWQFECNEQSLDRMRLEVYCHCHPQRSKYIWQGQFSSAWSLRVFPKKTDSGQMGSLSQDYQPDNYFFTHKNSNWQGLHCLGCIGEGDRRDFASMEATIRFSFKNFHCGPRIKWASDL